MSKNSKKCRYIINGHFLTKSVAGLGRTGREILRELDLMLPDEEVDVELCVPGEGLIEAPELNNIKTVVLGDRDSRRWTTTELRSYARRTKSRVISPVTQYSAVKHSIITMADVRYMEKDEEIGWYDSLKFRSVCRLQAIIGLMNADKVVTISEFSKERIKKYFRVSESRLHVINCGWQHFDRIEEDTAIFDRFPQLKDGNYYFTVGTLAPHKNHKWIKEVSQRNTNARFVICGGVDALIWRDGLPSEGGSNLIFTGYLSDGEMKTLMRNAKAFIFPSLYEGFGIPPLEAMSVGTDCIVSDIPVHREIFGGAVHYADPRDTDVDLDNLLREELPDSREDILAKYSWKNAAQQWLWLIKDNR